jgi:hypothetical protein
VREAQDDEGEPLQGEQEDKRHQDSVKEPGSDIHHSRGSGRSSHTDAEGNEDRDDDEEPRPAKRQKRHSQPSHKVKQLSVNSSTNERNYNNNFSLS